MTKRHWVGIGMFSLSALYGFAGSTPMPALVLLVAIAGLSILLPQRWLWLMYALWAGVLVALAFVALAMDVPSNTVILGGCLLAGVALVILADETLREYEVLCKLKVWTPKPTLQRHIHRVAEQTLSAARVAKQIDLKPRGETIA